MSDTDIREINSLYKVKKASLNSFQVMSLVHWTKEPKMHKYKWKKFQCDGYAQVGNGIAIKEKVRSNKTTTK